MEDLEVVTVQSGTPLGSTTETTLAAIGAVRAVMWLQALHLYGQHNQADNNHDGTFTYVVLEARRPSP